MKTQQQATSVPGALFADDGSGGWSAGSPAHPEPRVPQTMDIRARTMIPLLTLGTLLLAACEEPQATPGGEVAVRDSAGVRIISLPETGGVQARDLALDPEWPAGSDLTFGELVDLEVTSGGHVAVLDRMNAEVRVLDSEGRSAFAFGRPGEGPGEFSPHGLVSLARTDSTLVVPDLQLQRITEFREDGSVVALHALGPLDPSGLVYGLEWRAHPEGGLLARLLAESEDAVVRFDGVEFDTLYIHPVPSRAGNRLLSPHLVWDTDPQGRIVLARSDHFEVRLWDPAEGRLDWIARREDAPRPLTATDIDHLERLIRDDGDAMGASPAEQQEMLASIDFPEEAPGITGILAAPDGGFWVQRALPVAEMGRGALRVGSAEGIGSAEWERLDSEGHFRGVVRFPEGFTPKRIRGRWIHGIMEDALGVQSVARVALPEGE